MLTQVLLAYPRTPCSPMYCAHPGLTHPFSPGTACYFKHSVLIQILRANPGRHSVLIKVPPLPTKFLRAHSGTLHPGTPCSSFLKFWRHVCDERFYRRRRDQHQGPDLWYSVVPFGTPCHSVLRTLVRRALWYSVPFGTPYSGTSYSSTPCLPHIDLCAEYYVIIPVRNCFTSEHLHVVCVKPIPGTPCCSILRAVLYFVLFNNPRCLILRAHQSAVLRAHTYQVLRSLSR